MILLDIYETKKFQEEADKALKLLSGYLGMETAKYNDRLIDLIKQELKYYVTNLSKYQFLEKYYEIDDVKFRVEFSYDKTRLLSIQIVGVPEVLIPLTHPIEYTLILSDRYVSEKLEKYHPNIYEELVVSNMEELIDSYGHDKIYSSNVHSWVINSGNQNQKEMVYAFLVGPIPLLKITRYLFKRNSKGNWMTVSEENVTLKLIF